MELLRKWLGRFRSTQQAQQQVSETISEPPTVWHPEPFQEFSDERNREYTVVMLQSILAILERYHIIFEEDKKEPATLLTIEEDGQKKELIFPGAIPEPFFLLLLKQKVRHSIKENSFYDNMGIGNCNWRCTEDHVLEVLTGELAGQQIKGHKYWLDEYPQVVERNRPAMSA